MDYRPLALEPCYIHAVQNLPVVAKCIAQLIDYLIDREIFKLDQFHVIGFSLGAQTAGMIVNFMKNGKLKRITGKYNFIADEIVKKFFYKSLRIGPCKTNVCHSFT